MIGELFTEQGLLLFQITNTLFIAVDDARVLGAEDSLNDGIDFLVEGSHLPLAGADDLLGLLLPCRPGLLEHGRSELEQGLGGLEMFDDGANLSFDLVTSVRLAIGLATFGLAEVVGVESAMAPAREGRAQRRVTTGTDDHASKREGITDVLALGCVGFRFASFLDLVEQPERDDGLVLSLEPVDAVGLRTDMSGVERVVQHLSDAFLADLSVLVAWELWEAFAEPHNLCLGLEAARCEAFKGFSHDPVKRRCCDQHPPTAFSLLIAIADRCGVDPIPVLHPRFHLLGDLTAMLLAFELALSGEDGLNELAFGRVVEAVIEAIDLGVTAGEGFFQPEVEFPVSGKALQVVEDNDEAFVRLGINEAQQRHHTWTFHKVPTAADRIGEDCRDLKALGGGVLATANLLAVEPIAFFLLRETGNSAVDDRLSGLSIELSLLVWYHTSSICW